MGLYTLDLQLISATFKIDSVIDCSLPRISLFMRKSTTFTRSPSLALQDSLASCQDFLSWNSLTHVPVRELLIHPLGHKNSRPSCLADDKKCICALSEIDHWPRPIIFLIKMTICFNGSLNLNICIFLLNQCMSGAIWIKNSINMKRKFGPMAKTIEDIMKT